jgi:hypothetical protein
MNDDGGSLPYLEPVPLQQSTPPPSQVASGQDYACKGSGRSKEVPLGDYFPIPPGILTVDGRDPGSAYKPLPIADIYWSQTDSERGMVSTFM